MKNKMQAVRFASLQDLLDFLPADELKTLHFLRNIVLDCLPNCTEKLSYNVPYYRKNKGICFLWPGSVTWGKKRMYAGIRLGFNYGFLLPDEIGYLKKGDRKQVYWRDFISPGEVDADLLRTYLFEAEKIDRQFKKS